MPTWTKWFGRIIFPLGATVWFFNYNQTAQISALLLALLFVVLAALYWVEL